MHLENGKYENCYKLSTALAAVKNCQRLWKILPAFNCFDSCDKFWQLLQLLQGVHSFYSNSKFATALTVSKAVDSVGNVTTGWDTLWVLQTVNSFDYRLWLDPRLIKI